ncbi:MAG TPA: tetratricopeptide repeat protein [Bacteroidales bacterium]|nr:tetratricopeptide repeat protein [Bacteroidales bacterium]
MRKVLLFIFLMPLCSVSFSQSISDNLMHSKALASSGKYDLAISVLTKAIESATDYRLYLMRAEVNEAKGDYSAAINDYNEANKINSLSGEYGLARVYAMKGDVQTSLYHLEQNMSTDIKKSEKEIMLDPGFTGVGKKADWRNFWKKEHYTWVERTVSEIEFYTKSGMLADASLLVSELKSKYPGADETMYSDAILNIASGKPLEAVKMMSKITTGTISNEKYIRVIADAQAASSNYAGASDSYTRLIDSGTSDARLLLARAECYRKTGEIDKSISDIDKYLEYYPDDMTALRMAGKARAASGDNLKALELFNRNLELHPNEPELYADRGNSYLAARSWSWAIKDYSMSLDLKPSDPEVWLNKGLALLNSGHRDEACHDFRKALRMGNKRASEYINSNCIR